MQEKDVSLVSAGFLDGSVQTVLMVLFQLPYPGIHCSLPVRPQSVQFVFLPPASSSVIQAVYLCCNYVFFVEDVAVIPAPEFPSIYGKQLCWCMAFLVCSRCPPMYALHMLLAA